MAKKRKATKKANGYQCHVCEGPMQLRAVIPAATIFPEMRSFQCGECGYLRTVESEAELVVPPWVKAPPPNPSGASA